MRRRRPKCRLIDDVTRKPSRRVEMRATRRMFPTSRAIMTAPTLFVILAAIEGRGRSPNEQLPITAPGTFQFEVASIRENKGGLSPSNAPTANVGMNNGEGSPPADSSFSVTNMRLIILLRFAYKLSFFQEAELKGQLPDWALKDSFDRTPGFIELHFA
jgi:hypothetical protein